MRKREKALAEEKRFAKALDRAKGTYIVETIQELVAVETIADTVRDYATCYDTGLIPPTLLSRIEAFSTEGADLLDAIREHLQKLTDELEGRESLD